MTYDELIALVEDEIIDLDATFTTHIAQLMERAHLRIQHNLDLNATRIEETFAVAEATVFMPSDLIMMRGVRLKDGEFLMEKDVTFVKDYWPDDTQTGTPKYYCWQDDQTLRLAPTPTSTEIEVLYTVRIPVLSTEQKTNWLSEYAPDLLQFALLMEAAIWTKDGELISLYNERYKAALNGIALEYNLRKRSDDYRTGEPVAGAAQ